jgi:copper homeostasis protein
MGLKQNMELEICVDSVESAVAAEAGGAQRIELCSALAEGGLTPSAGLIDAVRARVGIGVHVMIRPRGGDFCYSQDDLRVMRRDIQHAAEAGADGVVLGLLTPAGEVNIDGTRALIELARPMQVTFHRAIDMTPNVDRALEDVIRSGADRILTSGAAQTATAGTAQVASLVHAASGRIRIMVCGGVRPENIEHIARETGASEFHAALRTVLPSPVTYRKSGLALGDPSFDAYERQGVLVDDVRSLRSAIDRVLVEEALDQK